MSQRWRLRDPASTVGDELVFRLSIIAITALFALLRASVRRLLRWLISGSIGQELIPGKAF
eukprot:5710801-Alexandrium_andersonii.AAC.1